MSFLSNQPSSHRILKSQNLRYQNSQLPVNYQLRVYLLLNLFPENANNKQTNFNHEFLVVELKIEFLDHCVDVLLILKIGLARHFLDQA